VVITPFAGAPLPQASSVQIGCRDALQMQWFRGALRQACRNSWGATAGLALVTLLIHLVIDNYVNKTFDTRSAPWCLIPVFPGNLILNGRQEGLPAVLFLSLEVSHTINHRLAPY
jgi:hypothetical protein